MTVEEAQRHNASRMSRDQLRRELHRVEQYLEQPPIRVRWIEILREALAGEDE